MENLIILVILLLASFVLVWTNKEKKTLQIDRKYRFRKYVDTDNQSSNIYCDKGIDKNAELRCTNLNGCKGFTVDLKNKKTCYKSSHWPRVVLQDNVDYYQTIFPNAN